MAFSVFCWFLHNTRDGVNCFALGVDRLAHLNGFMRSSFGGKLVTVSSVCTCRECMVELAADGNGWFL